MPRGRECRVAISEAVRVVIPICAVLGIRYEYGRKGYTGIL